jgi:hypothetical protein
MLVQGKSLKRLPMPTTLNLDQAMLHQWLAEKLDTETIREKLQMKGLDEESVSAYLREYRKKQHEKKRFIGFTCCGAGALLGFLACLLTLMADNASMGGFFLFGLTSIAVLVIFAGLYLIFE